MTSWSITRRLALLIALLFGVALANAVLTQCTRAIDLRGATPAPAPGAR